MLTFPRCSTTVQRKMSRHLNNLEALCNKLQQRYGSDDPIFLEVKTDLEAEMLHSPRAAMRHDWSVPYRTLILQQRNATLAQSSR
ncbi:MAG TPA: hypothetical protein PLB25_05465 [Rhodoferax sp.]|nr:hypothetical protein [Rhodoferax sp.]